MRIRVFPIHCYFSHYGPPVDKSSGLFAQGRKSALALSSPKGFMLNEDEARFEHVAFTPVRTRHPELSIPGGLMLSEDEARLEHVTLIIIPTWGRPCGNP